MVSAMGVLTMLSLILSSPPCLEGRCMKTPLERRVADIGEGRTVKGAAASVPVPPRTASVSVPPVPPRREMMNLNNRVAR